MKLFEGKLTLQNINAILPLHEKTIGMTKILAGNKFLNVGDLIL